MFLKILNSILILLALFMGVKQGWAMLTGKPDMLQLFSKWNIGRSGVTLIGAVAILGAVLVLFPRTFVSGNFITAAGILFIIAWHLYDRDWKGVAIELPFFLLSLVILSLHHPLANP